MALDDLGGGGSWFPTLGEMNAYTPEYSRVLGAWAPFSGGPQPPMSTMDFMRQYGANTATSPAAVPASPAAPPQLGPPNFSPPPQAVTPPQQQPNYLMNFLAGLRAPRARQVPQLPQLQLGGGTRLSMIGRGVRGV